MTVPLPWQNTLWRQIVARRNAMPHALLLSGPQGIGKQRFAQQLAAGLLCQAPQHGHSCGECRPCHLHSSGNHPDFLSVEPEKRSIVVDQIRGLIEFSILTRHFKGPKLLLISPAEALNRHAANSLLKVLEEPPAECIFILISHAPGRLPATLRSRCQQLQLRAPTAALALTWMQQQGCAEKEALPALEIAEGSPFRALEMLENDRVTQYQGLLNDILRLIKGQRNPVLVAREWKAIGGEWVVRWMLATIAKLGRYRLLSGHEHDGGELAHAMQKIGERLDLACMLALYQHCLDTRRLQAAAITLNEPLLLEGLAIAWAEAGELR